MSTSAAPQLELDVLLFASAADALGTHTLRLTLPASSTVADLRVRLRQAADQCAADPAARMPSSFRIAVNQTFADDDRLLSAGDEVAVIPPVAGG